MAKRTNCWPMPLRQRPTWESPDCLQKRRFSSYCTHRTRKAVVRTSVSSPQHKTEVSNVSILFIRITDELSWVHCSACKIIMTFLNTPTRAMEGAMLGLPPLCLPDSSRCIINHVFFRQKLQVICPNCAAFLSSLMALSHCLILLGNL